MTQQKPLFFGNLEAQVCSASLRLSLLSGLPFFADLTRPEIEDIDASFRELGFLAAENIYLEGDPAERLYVVATGRVKLLRSALSGQEVLYDVLAPGEFFGSLPVLGETAYPDTAQAATACCLLAASNAAFQEILKRYPAVTLKVLEAVGQRLRSAQEAVKQLSTERAERRIAAVLLRLAEKLGEHQKERVLIQTPLSRQDLAAMTGTTVETASRTLSRFRRLGWIQSGREWIAILNLQALERLKDEM